MGTMLCKQAADRATSPNPLSSLNLLRLPQFGIMRFPPHSSRAGRKIEGVCPPDPSTMARCERDGSCGGSRKMMMMMITGEERQEGSGVGHISPPLAISSLIFFLTFRGRSQSVREEQNREEESFWLWRLNFKGMRQLGFKSWPFPKCHSSSEYPGAGCHHLSHPAGGHFLKRKMEVTVVGEKKNHSEFLIKFELKSDWPLYSLSQVQGNKKQSSSGSRVKNLD